VFWYYEFAVDDGVLVSIASSSTICLPNHLIVYCRASLSCVAVYITRRCHHLYTTRVHMSTRAPTNSVEKAWRVVLRSFAPDS